MKTILLAVIVIVAIGLFLTTPLTSAEKVGASVSKIITNHSAPGYASAAILICAGNTPLSYPGLVVSSDQETKYVVYEGDVPVNTCHGKTVEIKTNDLSSISAALRISSGQISLDEPTRDVTGEIMFEGMSVDGQLTVKASSSIPNPGSSSQVKVEFLDAMGNSIQHVNYDIAIKQNGITVLDEPSAHTHTGIKYHETQVLGSDSPLDITLVLRGLGLPGEEVAWEGPQGDVIQFMAVPEFGTIASVVLIITISAVVVLGAKSKIQITQ